MMNEFDISYDGYTPDQTTRYAEPYRPPREGGSYRPPRLNEPTSIPDSEGFGTRFQPIDNDTDQRRRHTEPRPQGNQHAARPRAEEPQRQPDAVSAQDRKEKREKRRQELLSQSKREPFGHSIVRFFDDERTRLFLALTLIFTSIFVLIAVISHFNHGGEDQSVMQNLPLSEVAKNQGLVGNATGGFGAWLSHALLCDALGLGSLVLIPYLWIVALDLLKLRTCKFWATTFRCLLLAISISVVLGFVTYTWQTVVYFGGNHGHYVNKYLFDNATWIGAAGVSLLLVSAVCCVYLNELRTAYKKWQTVYKRHKLQEELRRERQRELERLEEEAEQERRAEEARAKREAKAQAEAQVKAAAIAEVQQAKRTEMSSTQSNTDTNESLIVDITDTKATVEVKDTVAYKDETTNADIIIDRGSQTDQNKTSTQVDENFTVSTNEIEKADPIIQGPVHECDGLYDHKAELPRYQLPTLDLLEDRPSGPVIDMEEQQANKAMIEKTLLDYKIPISKIEATVGPTVTLYEIVPAEGVRISQIKRLEDDIALSLKALGIRIIAPIPGKGTVGIEVPNNDPRTVSMHSVINSKKYQECKMALPMAMGATISNDIFIADMAKMPHLLVAGATGMGKSVGLNVIIASLLYKKHPSELKLVLIDPKMVEFSLYSKLERHYLAKLPNEDEAIITDMKKVIQTLNSLCVEMDNRYELLRDANVRSLEEYNKKFTERRLSADKGHKYLPYIVVIVDEFADLIMTQGKEVEQPIARIAQKARAVGIHMILATQRPSTNVITGLIKANFPGRIAFRVIQMVDSRTILDCPGANQLIGRGDMLFSHNGIMERVQCAFISTEEVERLTKHIDDQVGYEHAYYLPEFVPEEPEGGVIAGASTERDALFNEAARFVVTRQQGSTSSLQRQFGIGYNRAGKLMDQMEAAGIVGPVNGAKPRTILMDIVTLESILGD